MRVWGIHNDTLTSELVENGFISIGWDMLGNLALIPDGREGLKRALERSVSEDDHKAIPGWAGILLRFRDEIQQGDLVVAPYKPNGTINIGVVSGDYEYIATEPIHRNRRRVDWKQIGLSRTVFTQPALYEIGSALTLFNVRNHDQEFRAALSAQAKSIEELTQIVEKVAADKTGDENPSEEPRASRIERQTRDFVLDALQEKISHRQFEEFTADLLRALGYEARVTQYSQDGGVDVIAHSDPLGIEPPLIKVQCKHKTGTIGAPEVQQLIGTQGPGELALFVTLGPYSRDALALERQRPGIRLLNGEDVVSLVLANYSQLPERWRTLFPLTTLWVVSDDAA